MPQSQTADLLFLSQPFLCRLLPHQLNSCLFPYIHKPPPSSSSWPPTCSSNINILIPIYSPSCFWTCPNHLSMPLLTISKHLICAALLMYSFLSFSTLITHKASLNIFISAPFSSATCLLLGVCVSKPRLLHHTSPLTFVSTSTPPMSPQSFTPSLTDSSAAFSSGSVFLYYRASLCTFFHTCSSTGSKHGNSGRELP